MTKQFYIFSLCLLQTVSLHSQSSFPNCNISTQSTYLVTYKSGDICTNGYYATSTIDLNGNVAPSPVYTSTDASRITDGIGLNVKDGLAYGMTYIKNSSCAPGSEGISLFRLNAVGGFSMLGTIPPPSYTAPDGVVNSGEVMAQVGTIDGYGDYVFLSRIVINPYFTQLFAGRITNVKDVIANPGNPLNVTYTPILDNYCAGRVFSDWAINPSDGMYYSYGIRLVIRNGVYSTEGQLMVFDLFNGTIYCAGSPNTTEFTNYNKDNFTGIMFGTDLKMYGINSNTGKFYKINPATGALTYLSTIAGGGLVNADLATCFTALTILPIDFSNVSATPGGECKVGVSWNANGAEDGDKFYVQKSTDGRTFTNITSLIAVHNTIRYSVTDNKPEAINYYRIIGVSKDGGFKYSPVVRTLSSCGGKNSITLLENPVVGSALDGEISLYKTQKVNYKIINTTGAKVFDKSVVTNSGISRFSLPLPALAKGVYLLQTVVDDEMKMQKFIVQ